VDPAYLSALGVTHYYLPDDLDSVNKIASERNYKNRDEIEISPELLPGYEEKVKTFFHEHLHEDEEIRYILAGGGYFDVRSRDDDWVRLRLEKGDLMIMPAGIYHRFTTDDQNVIIYQTPRQIQLISD
jgi:1,2-dihydroxy-3-keto-5-methylthiopentene dioxygenase